MLTLEAQNRIFGTGQPDHSSLVLDILNEELTVGELIDHAVREEIHTVITNQRSTAIRRKQKILFLTAAMVSRMEQEGVLRCPACNKPIPRTSIADAKASNWHVSCILCRKPLKLLNEDAEVELAHQAFANRQYFVFVDGVQAETLQDRLTLTPTSIISFLRLIPLRGG